METFRIRYLHGANSVSAIQLVREFMGIGRRDAKEVVETRGLILDRVSPAEVRRVVRRFAEIGAQVEVERTWRHVLAYDPDDPARGDQPIQRLRAGELELSFDEGRLGALEAGELESFADEALTQRRVIAQLERWRAAKLALADSEIAVLEAISERDLGLEAALREHPDDVESHLIYGDWLQARGDPRGQLIALQHAVARAPAGERRALAEREREFRARHLGHLFGPLRPLADSLVLRWSLGMIDAAFVGATSIDRGLYGPFEILEVLLRLPIAARMSSLGLTSALVHRHGLERLLCGSEVVACLRELELGDHLVADRRPNPTPTFSRLWPRLRKLRKLTIHGEQPPLRALHSPTLEHLELHMRGLPDNFPERFVAGRLPELRTLTLNFIDAHAISPGVFADLLALPELDGVSQLILR
ncbi:MAG TPA: ribosomal protein L7/L12, partial [Enhygromyxa sp.]|nr:ribosomal protein L7/L12 [Enhygromyxa sp.]